jgi:hypothetical protein
MGKILSFGGKPVPLRGCGETDEQCFDKLAPYDNDFRRTGPPVIPGVPESVPSTAYQCYNTCMTLKSKTYAQGLKSGLNIETAFTDDQKRAILDEVIACARATVQEEPGGWDTMYTGSPIYKGCEPYACQRLLNDIEDAGTKDEQEQSWLEWLFGETSVPIDQVPDEEGGAESGLTLPAEVVGGQPMTTSTAMPDSTPADKVASIVTASATGMSNGEKVALGAAVAIGLYLILRK